MTAQAMWAKCKDRAKYFWGALLEGFRGIGEGFRGIGEGFSAIFGASDSPPPSLPPSTNSRVKRWKSYSDVYPKVSSIENDIKALRGDWQKVHSDFEAVLKNCSAKDQQALRDLWDHDYQEIENELQKLENSMHEVITQKPVLVFGGDMFRCFDPVRVIHETPTSKSWPMTGYIPQSITLFGTPDRLEISVHFLYSEKEPRTEKTLGPVSYSQGNNSSRVFSMKGSAKGILTVLATLESSEDREGVKYSHAEIQRQLYKIFNQCEVEVIF